MAITGGDRLLWRRLRQLGAIPRRPAVLELGRANWYGDVRQEEAEEDFALFAEGGFAAPAEDLDAWRSADWYYDLMLRRPTRVAIDLDPAAVARGALAHDLNRPLPPELAGMFDLVVNTGTAEHVFDLRRVWESCHDAAKAGGLMVHALPAGGWFDHGFVCYQPTLVADVAAENGYEVLAWFVHQIRTRRAREVASPADVAALRDGAGGHDTMMHVALRKGAALPFRVPMQGVYSERGTDEQRRAWLAGRQ
jgi:SAM-dependent methyltransferase